MSQPLILTLDAGTTGVKGALFGQNGEAVFTRTEGYETLYPQTGWAQQHPETQLAAAVRVIRAAVEAVGAKNVCALVFTGTMNGCIPIDRDGVALYDNIIHSDIRAAPQTRHIAGVIPPEDFFRVTGNRIDVHAGLPKYLWLREHEPALFRRAWKFVNIKDYLYGRATGLPGRTDRSDASLCSCLDMTTGDWAWDVLRALDIPAEKMPEIHDAYDVSGRLCEAFARETGLPTGLPVAIGAGDGTCAAHGARADVHTDAYINIGSSAWISVPSDRPVFDPGMRIFNYFGMDGGSYNVVGTVQCASSAFNWALETLFGERDPDFTALEQEAQSVPIGAEGVFFLPTLMGERTPWWTSDASGTLIGMTLYHERRHLIRAVYEGVMQALCTCGLILRENGLTFPSLTLIGGGAQSPLWAQMAASMFGVPARVHATPHAATSMGAAFAAGVGVGLYESFEDAARRVRFHRQYDPIPDETPRYERHGQVYRSLYPAMKDAYKTIRRYQTGGEGACPPCA